MPYRPVWNPALERVLRYSLTDLQQVYEHIWQTYAMKYPEQLAEVGAVPIKPSPEDAAAGTPARLAQIDTDPTMTSPNPSNCMTEFELTPDSVATGSFV